MLNLWGRIGIYFRAKKKIQKGEELLYDYGHEYEFKGKNINY